MTDSDPTMDAADLTPSKRRRTAESPTPATTQQPYVLPLRGTSLARLACDVGAMAAATARHGKFMASPSCTGPSSRWSNPRAGLV